MVLQEVFTAPFEDCSFKQARSWARRLMKSYAASTEEDDKKEGDNAKVRYVVQSIIASEVSQPKQEKKSNNEL